DETRTEQEVVAGTEHSRHVVEECCTRTREEIADRAAEERDEPAARVRNVVEVECEVVDHRLYVDAGILALDRCSRVVQGLLADVERHESLDLSGVAHGADPQTCLLRCTGAALDGRGGTGP